MTPEQFSVEGTTLRGQVKTLTTQLQDERLGHTKTTRALLQVEDHRNQLYGVIEQEKGDRKSWYATYFAAGFIVGALVCWFATSGIIPTIFGGM